MEEGAGEAYEYSQALPGSRSSSPGRPPSLRPYADLKSRALLLLCRLYLSTPPEDIIVCASLVLKPTPAAPEMVSVSVAEFAMESGAAPDVMNALYPPTSTRSPSPQASPGSAQTSPLMSSKRRTLRLGDSIIEAFRSPQTDRVSILTTQMYSIPTACMLNTWLRTLDLVVDYLNQLIPLAFSTGATPVAVDTSRFLPDIRLPSYFSFALNEFMLALRIYGSNFPDMEPSIKVAAVKAPETLQPSKALVEAEGHPLPSILQYLGMAIDALAPSFSVLSATDLCSSQIDLGPFVKRILDVLRTANEYFVYGLKELAANETPSLWLVNNIASVQHKVEKLLPFQLNNLLSTDLLQLGASSARRKAASGDICYRLLHAYLGTLDVWSKFRCF